MKIEVWKPPEKKPEPEKVLRLRMVQDGDKANIDAVRADGLCQEYLFEVRPDGLRRIHGVSATLGLPLDDKGRVVLVGEE